MLISAFRRRDFPRKAPTPIMSWNVKLAPVLRSSSWYSLIKVGPAIE